MRSFVSVLLSVFAVRAAAQANLLQNADFAVEGDLSEWIASPPTGYSADNGAVAHVWCSAGACGWLAQDLGGSLSNLTMYEIGFSGYCRSTNNVTSYTCQTTLSLGGQSFVDTLSYLAEDPTGNTSAWPRVSHMLVYDGGGTAFNLTTDIAGYGMFYMALPSVSVWTGSMTSSSATMPSTTGSLSPALGSSAGGGMTTSVAPNSPASTGPSTASSKHGSRNLTAIAVGCAIGVGILGLVAAGIVFYVRKRSRHRQDSDILPVKEARSSGFFAKLSSRDALFFAPSPTNYTGCPELQSSSNRGRTSPYPHPVRHARQPDVYF